MTKPATPAALRHAGIQVNRYFAEHPEMVLGEHALRRGIYGPGLDLHLPAAPGRHGP